MDNNNLDLYKPASPPRPAVIVVPAWVAHRLGLRPAGPGLWTGKCPCCRATDTLLLDAADPEPACLRCGYVADPLAVMASPAPPRAQWLELKEPA